ncbi:hypothetical protein J6590_037805 [Homalodisca vitripennis]|nr:hypothetical protein J6590_037805 [Homalodisca vitripennis]
MTCDESGFTPLLFQHLTLCAYDSVCSPALAIKSKTPFYVAVSSQSTILSLPLLPTPTSRRMQSRFHEGHISRFIYTTDRKARSSFRFDVGHLNYSNLMDLPPIDSLREMD